MKKNKKIIDKIYKCLRLAESGNPNEAALALRQAQQMMKKYDISDADVMAAEVSECATEAGERFNPPFWALALANLVADAFQCRNLIRRQLGRRPEFRFIGLGRDAEVATYVYSVLHRYLSSAIEEFGDSLQDMRKEKAELQRRIEVFAQAWLFRVGRTVDRFIGEKVPQNAVIDDYIREKYGEAAELSQDATKTESADYDDILSGLRAAENVTLYRSMRRFAEPNLLHHKRAS